MLGGRIPGYIPSARRDRGSRHRGGSRGSARDSSYHHSHIASLPMRGGFASSRRAIVLLVRVLLGVLALLLAWLILGLLTSGQFDPVALAGLVVSLIGLLSGHDPAAPRRRTWFTAQSSHPSGPVGICAPRRRSRRGRRAKAQGSPHPDPPVGPDERDFGQALPVRLLLEGQIGRDLDTAMSSLADAYSRIPSGRLVIIGEPGAGKSVLALILALGLLGSRAPGDPVAVLASPPHGTRFCKRSMNG